MRQLVKIKQRMANNLTHLPNYTCQATIERFRDMTKTQQWERVDTHQVEVALVGDDEWFSRPGAGRLETRNLRDLIPTGMLSTGDYANHTRAVFISNAPRFEYAGADTAGGRAAVRFHYSVSLFNSGYRISSGADGAVVAFHGTFLADPSSGDLLRLDVTTDDIPPEVGISEAVTTVEYAPVRIGSTDFLLPEHTELTLTSRRGYSERNRMTFTQCRQYGTESVVSFETPESLPMGLALTLELDPTLDPESLRGGAAVFAKLASDVRNKDGILIPAGAVVRGRVLQLDRRPGPAATVRIILEFDEVIAAEHHFHFNAVLESVTERERTRRAPETNPRPGVLSLIAIPPLRLGGLISNWRTQ